MIKQDKGRPAFHPTFGSRPKQITGRDSIIEEFMGALHAPIGAKERCTIFLGQRGMGKTVLLQELAERAEADGFISASVTAYSGMNDEIVEIIQRKGSAFINDRKNELTGIEMGALGFSFGLSFTETAQEQFGFRTKLTMLLEKLEKYEKGVAIFVDEVKSSEEMRQLAITYQQLVGEEKNIVICMAGLPQSVSTVLNDQVLTFLHRANKVSVGPISITEIENCYQKEFLEAGMEISDDTIHMAAEMTKGFPYMMQLVGYYLVKYASYSLEENELFEKAIAVSRRDLEDNVFLPIIRPLSDNDLRFLQAMTMDDEASKTADICKRLKKSNSYIQPYRARLIEAGIIESERKGEVKFAVPYLKQYLKKQNTQVLTE